MLCCRDQTMGQSTMVVSPGTAWGAQAPPRVEGHSLGLCGPGTANGSPGLSDGWRTGQEEGGKGDGLSSGAMFTPWQSDR